MNQTWLVALVLCAGFVIALALWRTAAAFRASRAARRRARRAQQGERAAEILLLEHGFAISKRQVSMTWPIRCNGEAHNVQLRADLIVEHSGIYFVAEVKTGSSAPLLTNTATRRQLLEYWMAYDVDGVLLVDVESWRILEIEFPTPPPPYRTPPLEDHRVASLI